MKKRMLSLLMALCLMLTLAPAAFATDATMTQTELEEAISDVSTGGTVELTGDVTLTSTLEITKPIVLDGKNFTITGASGVNTIYFKGVAGTVKNVNLVSGRYAIVGTGPELTVSGSTIATVKGGIAFEPGTSATTPKLNVTTTTIRNTNVTDYDRSADYGADNRGISTYNVKGGTVKIENCQILGFKYCINPAVDAVNGLCDGNGTSFEITGTTVKGWTALNIWSANTTFTFTDCNLVGINTLSGDSNGFCTIRANDYIYGGQTGKSSVVTFVGGGVTAVRLGSASQSVFGVDYERQTKYVFETDDDDNKVWVKYFGPENVVGNDTRYVMMWNFHPLHENNQTVMQDYLDTMVTNGTANGNILLSGGAISEYEEEIAALSLTAAPEVETVSAALHVGGMAE